jgi:hypothetical protein
MGSLKKTWAEEFEGSAGKTPRSPEERNEHVSQEAERLSEKIERATVLLAELCNRLGPVLVPHDEAVEKDAGIAAEKFAGSPMAEYLRDDRRAVQRLIEKLSLTIRCLDL